MNRPGFIILALLALAVALAASPCLAAEEILDWHSDIVVQADGDMTVTETIRVRAEGRQIKRGIFRDFPTTYRDRLGNRVKIHFTLVSVQRDGRVEPYHTENLDNGIRIYAGSRDVVLKPGIYTYAITYLTGPQLGFFEDHDELYWNVTGNGWVFPIRRASASVSLPGVPMDQVRMDGFTGPQGSRERAFSSRIEGRGRVVFEASRSLGPFEGLTIVVGWPKGYVSRPGPAQKTRYFLTDNLSVFAGFGGLLALLLYYLRTWTRVGKDPKKGTIIPRFEPPDGLSPASTRYILEMGFDNRAFASAVINLAVKGYLQIIEESGVFGLRKTYTLKKNEAGPKRELSKGEKKLAETLFPGGIGTLELEKSNHEKISGAIETLKGVLKKEYSQSLFITNRKYRNGGILVTGAALFLSVLGIHATGMAPSVWMIMLWFILILGTNMVFNSLLKAPTRLGRRIMDRIEGFRMYLSTAEEHRLEKLHPPDKTPELFEKYLPYALALEVDQQWSEKFAQILERAAQAGYSPSWYAGSSWDSTRPGMFASALGSSLSSAVSSSSTPPGSSSGFGGGGSSGGGGGGGGGGGW
ncbi:MAG: DUF2207 domain-containing protein [Proteobacteria bacterium]|nr:DUF2207 domain-containing protein [Pseudomonadota bacterium]